MLLSAIFAYCIAKFTITEINVFGVIKFKTMVQGESLLKTESLYWVAISFALFGLVSFVNRSFFERIPRSKTEKEDSEKSNLYYSDLRAVGELVKKIERSQDSFRLNHLMENVLERVSGQKESGFDFRASVEGKETDDYLQSIVERMIATKQDYINFHESKESYSPEIVKHTLSVFEKVQIDAVKIRNFVRTLPRLTHHEKVDFEKESAELTTNFYRILESLKVNHGQLLSNIKSQRVRAKKSKLVTDIEILMLSVILPVVTTILILGFSVYEYHNTFLKLLET